MSEFDNYYENNSTTPDAEDVNKAAQDYEKAETAQSEPHTASQSVSQEQANSSDTQQTTPAEGSYEWNSGNGSGEYRHSYVNGNNRDSARCIVRINGKKHYYFLGRYGSPQAESEYRRIKAQFDAETVCTRGGGFTSSDLFRQYAVTFFDEKLTRDQRCEMLAIRYAEERFPPFYLEEFSMAILVAYQ